MRIALFSESYEPVINGVSRSLAVVREGLVERGHQVRTFAPHYTGYTDFDEHVVRVPAVHTLFAPEYPIAVPWAPTAKRLFADFCPDVVHTQTPFVLGHLGARWASQFRVPLVSTNHTLYAEYAHYMPLVPASLTKRLLISMIRRYYSRCALILVPSSPVRDLLHSYGIHTPITVVKTGLTPVAEDALAKRVEMRGRLGFSEENVVLLYVGRVAPEKNLDMLLAAFSGGVHQVPNLRLVIVGGGPALTQVTDWARRINLDEEHITFTGMLPRKEADLYFAAADVFVFPSITDTQGLVVSEGMSAGMPVVAVNAGGVPENVRQGIDGFLTGNDAEEFQERIVFFAQHPDVRKRMGANAREHSMRYSVAVMLDALEMAYASVVTSR